MTLTRSERRAWDRFAAAALPYALESAVFSPAQETAALYADAMISERRKRMPTMTLAQFYGEDEPRPGD